MDRYEGVLGPPMDALTAGYQAMVSGVRLVETLSPVPLRPVVDAAQYIAIPLAVTTAATQVPVVGDVIHTLTQYGADWASSGATHMVGNFLEHTGQQIMGNLPQGFGIQTTANALGQAIEPLVMATTDKAAQLTAQLATGAAIGRGLMRAVVMPIQPLIEASQRAIQRAQGWLQQTQALVTNYLRKATKMSQENDQALNAATESNGLAATDAQTLETSGQVTTLQDGQDPDLTQDLWQDQEVDHQVQPPLAEAEEVDHSLNPADATEERPAPHDGKEEELSRVAIDYQNILGQRNYDVSNFQIEVDGQTAFRIAGGEVEQDNLTNDHKQMLRDALNDPQNVKGSVKIVQGGKTLFHVKDGKILTDTVGFSKEVTKALIEPGQSQQEPVTLDKAIYEMAAKGVKAEGSDKTQQVANNALANGATPEQVKAALLNHDAEVKATIKDEGLTQEQASQRVDQIIERAQRQSTLKQSQPRQRQLAATAGKGR